MLILFLQLLSFVVDADRRSLVDCSGLDTTTSGTCYIVSCYSWRNAKCEGSRCRCRSGQYTADNERCIDCPYSSCTDPEGAHGSVRTLTRFENTVVNAPSACVAEDRTSTCNDGTWGGWTGSYIHLTCSVNEQCTTDGGVVFSHGGQETRTKYETSAVNAPHACVQETQIRTCSDGVFGGWSGSYAYGTCTVNARCSNPDREHGDSNSRIRYATSAVSAPAYCVPETQTSLCTDGSYGDWSGTHTASTCVVYAQCTNPDMIHNTQQTRTRYENSQVNAPASCVSETQSRTCNDGTYTQWSGTFEHDACDVNDVCSGDVIHGETQTRIRYETATVLAPATCEQEEQSRICNDGNFLEWVPENYEVSSCVQLKQCTHTNEDNVDELITHGEVVTRRRYQSNQVNEPESCFQETQVKICEDGTFQAWAPSNYEYDSCQVMRECHDPTTTHGGVQTRTRYQATSVNAPDECVSEVQSRTCNDGTFGEWTPYNYEYSSCAVRAQCTDPVLRHGEIESRVMYIQPRMLTPLQCHNQTQTRQCDDGVYTDWDPFDFDSPTCVVYSHSPSSSPSVSPSLSPTIDCNAIKDGDECRAARCSWAPQYELCTYECVRFEDKGVEGTRLTTDVDMDSVDDCERACLYELECTRFAYTGTTCSIYGETVNDPYSHGTISGICFHTHYPTVVPTQIPTEIPTMVPTIIPTLAPSTDQPTVMPSQSPTTSTPSVSPTKFPTSDQPSISPTSEDPTAAPSMLPSQHCPQLKKEDECRQADCAWKPHFGTCHFSCEEVLSTRVEGDPIGGDFILKSSWYECEVECLENASCTRFTFTAGTRACYLYDTYDGEADSPGTTMGICLHTFIPTMVPTMLPTLIPTEVPTTIPTTVPTLLPSVPPSNCPSTSPSVCPSDFPTKFPTTDEPTDKPTVFPSRSPSVSPSVVPTKVPTTDEPTDKPTAFPSTKPSVRPSGNPSTTPSVSPSVSPTTDEPSTLPTINPIDSGNVRQYIILDGNYDVVIGDNSQQFLVECSAELISFAVSCYAVRSGSIILTIEGQDGDVINAMNYIIRNGLNLPSFADLSVSSEFTDDWAYTESEDDSKPIHEELYDKIQEDTMYQIVAGAAVLALCMICCTCRYMCKSSDKEGGEVLEFSHIMATQESQVDVAAAPAHTIGAVELMQTPRENSKFAGLVPLKGANEGRRDSDELEIYGKRQPRPSMDGGETTGGLMFGDANKMTAPVAQEFLNPRKHSMEGGGAFSDSEGGDAVLATGEIRLMPSSPDGKRKAKITDSKRAWDGIVETGADGSMHTGGMQLFASENNAEPEKDGDETVSLAHVLGAAMPDSGDERQRIVNENQITLSNSTPG